MKENEHDTRWARDDRDGQIGRFTLDSARLR